MLQPARQPHIGGRSLGPMSISSLFLPSSPCSYPYIPLLPGNGHPLQVQLRGLGRDMSFPIEFPGTAPDAKHCQYFWAKEICLLATISVLFVTTKMSIWTKSGVSSDYIVWYGYIGEGFASRVRTVTIWGQDTGLGELGGSESVLFIVNGSCYYISVTVYVRHR